MNQRLFASGKCQEGFDLTEFIVPAATARRSGCRLKRPGRADLAIHSFEGISPFLRGTNTFPGSPKLSEEKFEHLASPTSELQRQNAVPECPSE